MRVATLGWGTPPKGMSAWSDRWVYILEDENQELLDKANSFMEAIQIAAKAGWELYPPMPIQEDTRQAGVRFIG
jgi:hypothetical protein